MQSFGYGPYNVRATSIEEGLAICKMLESFNKVEKKHKFDDNYQCTICGKYKLDCDLERIPCESLPKGDAK